ncbi:hypothetical protein QYE76_024673 [Lolium multiflorum]|uniref:Uncharacterized protein n=1 Tax=Lolium multiflorum TaxID=4521 RepID=A0AAD8RE43_LOLMU|nr:hypothetical protein QYE76_024673 [Lolium multiflorum]
MAAADLGTAEWERSKISNQDLNLLKKLGISKKPKALCFPSEESYPAPPMGYRPMIKDLLRIGAQFVGYREYANKTEEKLAEANERANTLAQQLEHSEEALKKAELDAIEARAEADKAKADAAGVEDLKKKLHTAETSLSDHIAAQSAREEALLKRIRTQSRRFVSSQQTIDWAKVGDTEQIEESRWKSLIKAAKPNTKKILAYLGIQPSATPSSSKPEV